MTEQNFNKKYIDICDNIAERRLKPAFDRIEKLIAENGLGTYSDECHNLEETYHYMLKYTVEGVFDPERQKIYQKLIVSVYQLVDKVYEAISFRFSPSVQYEIKRAFKEKYISNYNEFLIQIEDFYLQDEALTNEEYLKRVEEHQQQIKRFFFHIWFKDILAENDIELIRNFFLSPVILLPYKAFIVTALMLSLQRFFDERKFELLFDAYNDREVEINQRALVGLLVNLYKYDKRMPVYPNITGRLKILNEKPHFKRNLQKILLQLIRTKETEKLQERIRDEILPEMIKLSPNLQDKINLNSLMEEGLTEDKNPDWEEIFKDSPGFVDKMQEFSELQMEGADVFMGSFAMLKSFSFFRNIENWFMPFFLENPDVFDKFKWNDNSNSQLLEAIKNAPILCNSDKYSFCFSIQNLPQENMNMVTQSIKAEMEQLKDIEYEKELTNPGSKEEYVSNQYIQDLYRFYKLFPGKVHFEDIFTWKFDFFNKVILGDILKEDDKMLRNIAEFYFMKNYFEEASEIFCYLLDKQKNGELYQKLAYCYQKRGIYKKALESYRKAELYDVNQLWNLKKIALCYRNLKQPEKALDYYKSAERIDPESLNIQLNIGHCLLELNRFEEALKCYFKVEYLTPENKKVWRPIAWCSFLTGKKEQAEKYLIKLIKDNPIKHDFMNMGHVQWCLGNRREALDYYKKSIIQGKFSENEFHLFFSDDLQYLIKQGVERDDVPIMLDQLRYYLEE